MFRDKPYKLILPFHTLETLQTRIGWLVNLRWVGILGLLCIIPIGEQLFRFDLGFPQIYLLAVIFTVLNLIYFFLCKYFQFANFGQEIAFTEIQILLDFVLISFVIHYTGGIGNPFYYIYLVHIIISGILYHGIWVYINAIIAAFLLTIWSILEYYQIVNVYSLDGTAAPLRFYLISLAAFYILIFTATYIIRDIISGYRILKRVIDQKSELLEQTMLERDKMFRFTAHELKSPLTTLRSMLAVIDEVYSDSLQAELKEMVGRAVRRTDQVLMMVKEMIEVTQYRYGLTERKLGWVNFQEWIDKVVEQQRIYATNKKICLVVKKLSQSRTIYMDADSLEKILSNLINNAIRYSPPAAEITVLPFIKQSCFGFGVSDTGIGIAKDDMTKIFEEFYRSPNAREMENLGTGLGLSLVKQIVEQYHGRIYVESKLGQGSTFTVEMPYLNFEITAK
ncbi:MAG: ATP-binding protein [Candidatus Marinimicrobia bacterium]|nr:ATP-binding protein [Candidatus Neomarinimicrobiota bacterium]